MRQILVVFALVLLNASGILFAQKGADPAQRYFRLICLVHLTGSGQAGDPVVPEYVVQGTAVATAAAASAATANANQTSAGPATRPAEVPGGTATAPAPMASRPGYLAWSMQVSDDKTMAIVQIVAVDHQAFDSILADTRPEIRVFEIGKDSAAAIQTEMQKYKKNFDLESFKVLVQ